MIDTHCHLNDSDAFPDPAAAIAEASAAGVTRIVVVGVDTESSVRAVELAEQFDPIYAVVGWHPSYSAKWNRDKHEKIRELAGHPKAVAIGEIGLDYHRDYATPEQQEICLTAQLELARELDMPIVFHCREAYDDLLAILRERGPDHYLLHCFAGTTEQTKQAIELGCIFGVDGPVTYKKADDLRETLALIGLDRLVLETDAPWLTPVPYRGKPNHPKYLPFIRDGVAAALGVGTAEVVARTTATAERFFGLPSS